jgi:hypothetical protein
LALAGKKLEDRDYASTSARREMVTIAMRDGFAKAPRWKDERDRAKAPKAACADVSVAPTADIDRLRLNVGSGARVYGFAR